MELPIKKIVNTSVSTLGLYLKVSDSFSASLKDGEGKTLADYEGYVPNFMPGKHHGDYVILDIDLDTGVITNWRKPNPQDVVQTFFPEVENE